MSSFKIKIYPLFHFEYFHRNTSHSKKPSQIHCFNHINTYNGIPQHRYIIFLYQIFILFKFQMACASCECLGLIILALLFALLSKTVRYYVKMSVFFVTTFLMATILPIPLFILRPRDYRNAL